MRTRTISRRRFARESTSLVVGFSLAGAVSPVASWITDTRVSAAPGGVAPEHLDSWIRIDPNGLVTVYTGRIDMGTGIETAFSQLVADEMDVPINSVKLVMGDTGVTPDQGKSTGSNNTRFGAQPLRVAAAEARHVLVEAAASRLSVPSADLDVKDGFVHVRSNPSRRVGYGELLTGGRFDRQLKVVNAAGPELAGSAKPKDRTRYTVIGKSIPRDDVRTKVMGTFKYVANVRVPGMLHGRVVRPASVGATLVEVDESSIARIPTAKVVRKGNFLGVVAEREEHAIAAAERLKVRWSDARTLPPPQDLYSSIRNAKSIKDEIALENGDVEAALKAGGRTFEASYRFPMQLHGMIGPSCAVADVKADGVTIWSGTQWPQGTRADIAAMLEMPLEKVRVIWQQSSGCYGRMACDDAAADAALLSQAVGKPVRVQWMRHDEHGWEPLSPAMVMEVRAALDQSGTRISAWDLQQWSSTHSMSERRNFLAWRLIGTAPGWDRLSSAPGVYSYVFPHTRQTLHYVQPILRTVYLRAPGRIQHNFASESFMDEIAADAKVDPIEFRLRHLEDPNATALLKRLADVARWEPHVGAQKRMLNATTAAGRGFAFGEHSQGQQVALTVDVEVDLKTADIRVTRIVSASQCGLVINPEGLTHQVQGAILQGLSRTLMEEVAFTQQNVTSLDWVSYPIMRFSEIPPVEVTLVDQPDKPSVGVGETATIPVAAAVGNAVFDATGIRLRQVPLKGELRKALKL